MEYHFPGAPTYGTQFGRMLKKYMHIYSGLPHSEIIAILGYQPMQVY